MARPADNTPADAAGPIRAGPDGLLIRLKVSPGAKRSEVVGVMDAPGGARLKVRVAAPPEDGRANRAVEELLGGLLGVGRRGVEVESGAVSRDKVVRVRGITEAEARARLGC